MGLEKTVADLVERTRAVAADGSPVALREAFERTLATLDADQADRTWRDGADVIGRAFEQLLPGEERRPRGQFFTPFWAGEVMAGWLLSKPASVLLDPGVGSGSLLIPASRHPSARDTRMIGLDVDPLAISMAEVNKRLRGIEQLEFRARNFLLDEIPERPDAITCNPPYSRHHAIPAREKAAIHDGFQRRLGHSFSRLAGLHVLFLVRALEVSADDARLAFITPSDWLDVGYGREIKRHLLNQARVEALIFLDGRSLFFDGVLTTAAITLICKGLASDTPTKVLRLGAELPAPKDVLAALSGEKRHRRIVLSSGSKWARPGRPRLQGTRLGDIARVRRGVATGSNSFFVLSERRRKELRLSRRSLRPCIASPRYFAGTELRLEGLEALADDVPRWALDTRDPEAERRGGPLSDYLRAGRALAVNEGYLASRRNPWFALERRGACPILFSYFNRARPRFVRNHAAALPLNNWLIVEPRDGVDADELFRLLIKPEVTGRLTENCRVYGSGLWKLEPSELEALSLPRIC